MEAFTFDWPPEDQLRRLLALYALGLMGRARQKPRVIIAAYEQQAIEQTKQLRSDPATTHWLDITPVDPDWL